MAGIYIHIPFCKQACHYCDFHFSTSLKHKDALINAIAQELVLQKKLLANTQIATIYFGGGTPSLLALKDINFILDTISKNYALADNMEITLEANPDDLTSKKLQELAASPINRLSVGVQSFDDEVLQYMNRSHTSEQALVALKEAQEYSFDNITIDLIYGIPQMTNTQWLANLNQAFALNIPHISAYALTVEPKTALASFINSGKYKPLDESLALAHFEILTNETAKQGFVQYEISNFGKENYFSKHNTSYWQGKKYLGVGPSAHSFIANKRFWNIANNIKYIKSIANGILPQEVECLSVKDRYNEYIMTQFRTVWGVDLAYINAQFGTRYKNYFIAQIAKFLIQQTVSEQNNIYTLTAKGKFLADGISSDLFWI